MKFSDPTNQRFRLGLLAIATCTFMQSNNSLADEALAQLTVNQIESAIAKFKAECGVSVLADEIMSDVKCGETHQSPGEAWNRILADEGFPNTIEGRESLAKQLNLGQSASLCLVIGALLARPERIASNNT